MKIRVIEKKQVNTFGEWVAMKLVRMAQWVYPDSEAVKAFYTQMVMDELMCGRQEEEIEKEAVKKFANGFIGLLKGLPEGDVYTVNPIILELRVYLDEFLKEEEIKK